MIECFKHDDEEGRIRALQRYGVLGEPEEPMLETIIDLVQKVLKAPICAVVLVDRERQWFRTRRGLDVAWTPREVSFCTHTIKQTEPLFVRDALNDRLFRHNPLVLGRPGIRSYLGIPLITPDGYGIGSLCVIDVVPRTFSARDAEILGSFAKLVMEELELGQIGVRDEMTGIPSRQSWQATAETELERAKRYGKPLSVAVFDLDRFKLVDKANGHEQADRVIQSFAEQCMRQIRRSDVLGRYGGDSFVLMMPETDCRRALSIVERVRARFSEAPTRLGDTDDLLVTASAGLTARRGDECVRDLLQRADQSLLEAKRIGRNCTIVDPMIPLVPEKMPREMAG